MWSGAWNKRKLTSQISNRFLASTVSRAWDWWSIGCEFKPTGGNFLMKFILFCVTLYLSDNLAEMCQISLSWETRLDWYEDGYVETVYRRWFWSTFYISRNPETDGKKTLVALALGQIESRPFPAHSGEKQGHLRRTLPFRLILESVKSYLNLVLCKTVVSI